MTASPMKVGAIGALAFLGMIDTLYLSISRRSGPIPCHITSGCEDVVTSVYSTVAGIPLAWFRPGVLSDGFRRSRIRRIRKHRLDPPTPLARDPGPDRLGGPDRHPGICPRSLLRVLPRLGGPVDGNFLPGSE